MKILGITVKGFKKEKCEDAISLKTYKVGETEVFLFALADGAGSAENSQEGAQFLTQNFIKILRSYLRKNKHLILRPDIFNTALRNVLWNVIEEARNKLLEKAYVENKPFETFASTFIGGLCINSDFIKKVFYVSIGDSAIFTFKEEGDTIKLNHSNTPIKGEYTNTTVFLTSNIWNKVATSGEIDEVDYLFVSSDGLEKIFFRAKVVKEINEDKCPIYMKYLWKFEVFSNTINLLRKIEAGSIGEEELYSFLASEKCMYLNNDDKSLIIGVLGQRI